jgi:hypothetical protein
MAMITRRTLMQGGTVLTATGALSGYGLTEWPRAWAQVAPWKPEKDAQLSILGWKYFVQSEDDASANYILGTASWNDASNNKAFLGGEIYWTNNGISIYVAAQYDASKRDIAADMDHASWPVGPIGKPTEFHLLFPLLAMTYTKYPQACKALMAYMLEADQFTNKSLI